MPIRFRCCYCRQLLAIASRKKGAVTKCPTCLGHVWVPDPDKPDEEQPGPAPVPAAEVFVPPPEPAPSQAPVVPLSSRKTIVGIITIIVFVVFFFLVGIFIGRTLQR